MKALCTVLALLTVLPVLAQEVSILDMNTDGVVPDPKVYFEIDHPTLDGRLFFRGQSDDGEELWVTDGTATGTELVAITGPGTSWEPDNLTVSGAYIYFVADDGATGDEIW